MKLKIYKRSLFFIIAFLMLACANFAQTISSSSSTSNKVEIKDNSLQLRIDDLNLNLNLDFNDLEKDLATTVNNARPQIKVHLKSLKKGLRTSGNSINFDISVSDNDAGNPKTKSYSKTYPIDGNDRIKLVNQFGKITVNTWDRHEVKVDVFVKAEAEDDGTAQRLIDGVHISDGKQGDEVSFRTSIDNNNGSNSWKFWDFGGKKKHKLEIDYTVYMPAKTDLNVDQSYGAIVLPDLQGRVRISSSYGSVSAQNLSNQNNTIEGSYGSLSAGSINGAKLVFSYGSVDIAECNTVKAELSYGSFKLDKLKGTADMDLSNVGGFRIGEITNSLKKVNINASYSTVALGLADNNNFDFDITTTYGGFNYNDDKVTVTSKTPPDGSTYYSNTKNYKGRFGRGNSNVQMNIRTSYGGVKFE